MTSIAWNAFWGVILQLLKYLILPSIFCALITATAAEQLPENRGVQSQISPTSQLDTNKVATATPTPNELTIVIGGDLGLGGSRQPVNQFGARKHGKLIPWQDLTKGISGLPNGDINFANLETVVTESNSLPEASKTFTFSSHPAGVRHLVELGFNVFSTANNHAIDFGNQGMRDTMANLAKLKSVGLLASPGLGLTREQAGQPSILALNGKNVAISAIGIGGKQPTGKDPGILGYYPKGDFFDATRWLAETPSDYRILSVHYGAELAVRPSRSNVATLRDQVVRKNGVDLVIGHHAHVVAGVQEVDGKLIFYGLGNLLHPGMQNMNKFGKCRDYGLVAKIHLSEGSDGRMHARAVEVWPLEDMHERAHVMAADKARSRIAVLNSLSKELDDKDTGARGIRFANREDGSGLACLPGSAELSGTIGAQCRSWSLSSHDADAASSASCSRVDSLAESKRGRLPDRHRGTQGASVGTPASSSTRLKKLFQQAFGD